MKYFSLILFWVGVGGFIVAIACLVFTNPTTIENNATVLSREGRLTIMAFVISTTSLLISTVYEAFQANKKIDFAGKEVIRQYNEIARRFKIFPSLMGVLGEHFDLLEQLYSSGDKYQTNPLLKSLFERYVAFWFNNFIDGDLATCRTHLSDFELELAATDKGNLFHAFIRLFWESVPESGTIQATSIVKPPPEGGFWNKPEAYLEAQRLLVENRNVTIRRYFIFAEDHSAKFQAHKHILKLNIAAKIETRVVLFKTVQEAGDCYQDIGLVGDDLMAVENVINNGIIEKTCCHIKSPRRQEQINTICRIFTILEDYEKTFKSENKVYRTCDDFLTAIDNAIKEMSEP